MVSCMLLGLFENPWHKWISLFKTSLRCAAVNGDLWCQARLPALGGSSGVAQVGAPRQAPQPPSGTGELCCPTLNQLHGLGMAILFPSQVVGFFVKERKKLLSLPERVTERTGESREKLGQIFHPPVHSARGRPGRCQLLPPGVLHGNGVPALGRPLPPTRAH